MRLLAIGLVSLMLTSLSAELRLVPVLRTPEPNQIGLELEFPDNGKVEVSNPVRVQFRVEGFPIDIVTDVPRHKEIHDDPAGQAMHILIDDYPYVVVNEALIDALDDNADYFWQVLTQTLPYDLKDGMHVMRAFLVRSFRESLKGRGTYHSSIFYMKDKSNDLKIDLKAPYLVYNMPFGDYTYTPTRPILLDFLIQNCQLSRDGFKVRLTIDDRNQRVLTEWIPYYIYGLEKGSHKIRLQLLDPKGAVIPGFFNDVTKVINLK